VKLQIESIDIHDVQAGSQSFASDHILHINLEELEELLLRDKRIKSVDLQLVYPGDRVRILNLNDVIQPRCKIGKEKADFPGWLGRLEIAGQGLTRALRGMAVLVSNPVTERIYSAFLDMSGHASRISKYGSMINVSVTPFPEDEVESREFENAVKIAGLKTAVYLAQSAEGHDADEVESYDLSLPVADPESPLPRIAYYFQLYTPQRDFYKGIADPCFYGRDVASFMPTLIHPNEVLDGAITNPHTIYSRDTYSIQNHAVIKELYKRHGKELLFVGIVIGVANMVSIQRELKAMIAANLFSNILKADGVILTKYLGGMTQVDIGMVADECEKLGVKTTPFVEVVHSLGSLGEQIPYITENLDAVINIGQTLETIYLPLEADQFLGGKPDTRIFHPNFNQNAGDRIIRVVESLITGVHDNLGGSKIFAAEY